MPRWECKSDQATITEYTIDCEGWDYENDLNVVKGSCSIRYDAIYKEPNTYQRSYQSNYQTYSNFYDNGYFTNNQQLSPVHIYNI